MSQTWCNFLNRFEIRRYCPPPPKKKSKQNITRDIEIKNIVTIATGEWRGDSGEGVCRSYYKGHEDKIKGEGRGGGGRGNGLG